MDGEPDTVCQDLWGVRPVRERGQGAKNKRPRRGVETVKERHRGGKGCRGLRRSDEGATKENRTSDQRAVIKRIRRSELEGADMQQRPSSGNNSGGLGREQTPKAGIRAERIFPFRARCSAGFGF
jgi:hypothetical protein